MEQPNQSAIKTEHLCRAWWRRKVLYVCTQHVHTPHTHICRTAKLCDKTHKHWIHPHYLRLRKPGSFVLVQNSSIGQHHTPLIELHYSNSCQQFSAYIYSTHALSITDFWLYPLSVLPSVFTSHPRNKHQTPCKPCTKQDMWNQTWYHLHLRATSFHNYTIEQRVACLHWRLLV